MPQYYFASFIGEIYGSAKNVAPSAKILAMTLNEGNPNRRRGLVVDGKRCDSYVVRLRFSCNVYETSDTTHGRVSEQWTAGQRRAGKST